eukprot:CAMPEP_0117550120 /NCGR_PEP_ID=MMETSP0784-20121206/48516_1 /TAXON_ID=39447 /ORGANISM="" /LENGTH=31 /DNA_ID= /DNA_START= /DNA_END= /DNA_ORIENTATION=
MRKDRYHAHRGETQAYVLGAALRNPTTIVAT